jgi:hypothetical protein
LTDLSKVDGAIVDFVIPTNAGIHGPNRRKRLTEPWTPEKAESLKRKAMVSSTLTTDDGRLNTRPKLYFPQKR